MNSQVPTSMILLSTVSRGSNICSNLNSARIDMVTGLDLLWKQCLTPELAKCQLGMHQCMYVRHIVGSGEEKPVQSKMKAVERFPVLVTKMQVHMFIGITGYYHHFILDYVRAAFPPIDLTKKNNTHSVQ